MFGAVFAGAVAVNSGLQMSPVDLVMHAGPMVQFVLFCLLAASVFSWAIIIMKYKMMSSARKESQAFLNTFWYGQDLEGIYAKSDQYNRSPVASVFKAGYKELKKLSQMESKGAASMTTLGVENVSRALTRATMAEIGNMEKAVGVLATVGSATPFIGLFGTVWGIMNSFQGIGATGAASLAIVAPGISEALIATAAGLAAAIPAVMAYNYFAAKIKILATEMDTFSQDFLNIVQRSLMKE